MSVWKDLFGTVSNYFKIGIAGVRLKNNSGSLDVRNIGDTDYALVRVKTPVTDNDAVTKLYADSLSKPLIVSRQANCSASIPANTNVRGYVVVTTAGSGAVIGDVLYDNGEGATGNMDILPASEGRVIAITDALSGGTISFDPDSIYIWDADTSAWVKIGDIGSVTGAVRTIRYTINNSATQDSTNTIPANVRIIKTRLEVTTPYSGGATIKVGVAGTLDKFMTTAQNNPQAAEAFEVDQDTASEGTAVVARTTITGSPAAGAGVVSVLFTNPLA